MKKRRLKKDTKIIFVLLVLIVIIFSTLFVLKITEKEPPIDNPVDNPSEPTTPVDKEEKDPFVLELEKQKYYIPTNLERYLAYNDNTKTAEEVVREVEIGKIYVGKVVKTEDFGCFVELWPGCEGLVHISHLDTKRVEKTTDIVKVGDEIIVKAIGYDKRGKLNLSRKEVLEPKEEKREQKND